MKQYKVLFVVAVVVSLLLITASMAVAVGRQGNSPGPCTGDPDTCQMQNQGGQGGRGMGQGMGNRQGMQQGQGMGNQSGRGRQGNQGMGAGRGNREAHLPAKVASAPSAVVVKAMQSGILDEYNAEAIYAGVIQQLGSVRPFTNIQRAEQRHIAAWQFLFDRYGVTAPTAATVKVPEFATLAEACRAAASAEQANMDLYDKMLSTFKDYPDMTQVVTMLRTASAQKHLPAFEGCAGVAP